MDLLILGGTAFLGRAIAVAAQARGIRTTCLARGSAPTTDGVTFVRADRDEDDAYAAVAGRHWDAVVDVTRHPGHARRAVQDITAAHWVLVSSGNVYAAFDRPAQHESAALLEPLGGDVMADMSEYGRAKVACEEAVRAGCPSHTIVRAGLIGGFGDVSGRSGYYPWRCAHPTGEDVLVPDDPDFPIAMIDVLDLAQWLLICAEQHVRGTFNATGPTTTLGEVLGAARAAAGSEVRVTPVPAEVLTEAGVAAWMGQTSLPLWIDDPEWRWFATLDTSAARAHGLVTRPLETTLADALAFEEVRTEPRAAGLTDDEERSLRLHLCHART